MIWVYGKNYRNLVIKKIPERIPPQGKRQVKTSEKWKMCVLKIINNRNLMEED